MNPEDLAAVLRLQEQHNEQDDTTDSPDELLEAPTLIIHELYRRINNRFKSCLQSVREEWRLNHIRENERTPITLQDIDKRKRYLDGLQPLSDILELLVSKMDMEEDKVVNCDALTLEEAEELSVDDARLKYMRYTPVALQG